MTLIVLNLLKLALWQVHGKFLLKTSVYAEEEYALVTFRV